MFTPKIPDSSIKALLEELVSIAKKAETSDEYDSAGIMFKFSFPATESELKEVETYLDIELDNDYKNFMMFSNGAMICSTAARFFNTKRLISVNSNSENYIIIAELVGDGEVLYYSRDTHRFVSYFEGKEKEYVNFAECLDRIIRLSRDSVEEFVDFLLDHILLFKVRYY